MPELLEIAGEPVLNFSQTEWRNRLWGAALSEQPDIDQIDKPVPIPVLDRQTVLASGVLSDRELNVALAINHVVCDPTPRAVNGSSIDVRLGHYFYHAGSPQNGGRIFNPFSRSDTYRYFGIDNQEADFKEAKPWIEVKKGLGRSAIHKFDDLPYIEGIPEHYPMILLRPNERILAHTHEFIGIRPPGTTSMQARSTTGRIGLSACYCAGWGDPGYINRWTMEVHNLNENEFLPIPVGYRMAQIVFSMTGPVGFEYSEASGNYQKILSNDLAQIKSGWRPWQMLPKAYTNIIEMLEPVEGLSEGIK